MRLDIQLIFDKLWMFTHAKNEHGLPLTHFGSSVVTWCVNLALYYKSNSGCANELNNDVSHILYVTQSALSNSGEELKGERVLLSWKSSACKFHTVTSSSTILSTLKCPLSFPLTYVCFVNIVSNKENHHGNSSETTHHLLHWYIHRQREKRSSHVFSDMWEFCVFVWVCVCLHVQDTRVGYLGMSHHSSMFPFSSIGTLVFLLADLFSSCEVPVMHSLFGRSQVS